MIWSAVALAAGVVTTDTQIVAWDEEAVAFYDRDTLERQQVWRAVELKPHPRSVQRFARVRDLAVWDGQVWALVGVPGQTWLVHVSEEQARPVRTQDHIGGVLGTDEGLVYVADLGRPVRAQKWSVDGEWVVFDEDLRGARPWPELRSATLLKAMGEGLVARTAEGLVVLGQPFDEEGAFEAQRVVGVSEQPVADFGFVGSGRLVSVSSDGIERWSLLSPDRPWPLSVGAEPLDVDAQGLVQLEDGVWILAEGPGREVAPGVFVGEAWPNHRGGAVVDGRVLLIDQVLRLHPVEPPVVHPEPFGVARPGALSLRIQESDLPMGEGNAPGGSMPTYVAHNIDRLVELATPLKRFPLHAAQRYLVSFPDAERQATVDARADELERATTALATVLAIVLSLGTWLWRWGRRKVTQRDRALAAHFNPFRQDSPNNPARTPFAATGLVSELMRSLELNCVVVQGPELTGKSALLRHVAWRLESEGEVRVVQMELRGVPEGRFWTVLGRGVAEAYPECEAGAELLEDDEALDRDAVEYLLDECLAEGPRLVLVLDDLDTLGLYRHESQRFRGLIQIVPSHRMAVLGAGVNIRRGFGDHDESPWFNLFQVRNLRPMSEEELAEYLHRRLQAPFSFESGVPRRLHELTGGRALQVWHVCSTAAEELLVSRRVTLKVADLDEAVDRLKDMAGAVVPGDDEAWEALLQRVAEARRRRDALLAELGERRQQQQADLLSSFFTQTEAPDEG